MEFKPPLIWTVLGLGLIIAEMFSLSLVLLFFGVAALLVAILAYLGPGSVALQILLFALLGVGGILLFRKRMSRSLRSGRDVSPDRNVPITLSADLPAKGTAEIQYQGALWTAMNESDADLKKGARAYIHGTEGVKLVIKDRPMES